MSIREDIRWPLRLLSGVQKYDADLAAGEKTITEASKQNGVSLHCGDSVESE